MPYAKSACTISVMTFLLLGIFARPVYAERHDCEIESAERAEVGTDYLRTWGQIYDWYTRYSACDDGAIAEGFSQAVVNTFALRWYELPKFATLADRDIKFRGFVFKHIDATTDDRDLDRVVANATRHCPQHDAQLCSTIRRQAVAARSEQDKIYPPKGH
jgi:hypothetical protein